MKPQHPADDVVGSIEDVAHVVEEDEAQIISDVGQRDGRRA